MLRGIRGAIVVKKNKKEQILSATARLLSKINAANKIKTQDIAAIIFSATPDLNAEFPAKAALKLKWGEVPRLCTTEIAVPGALKKCIRILLLVNTNKPPQALRHIYLDGAEVLRS